MHCIAYYRQKLTVWLGKFICIKCNLWDIRCLEKRDSDLRPLFKSCIRHHSNQRWAHHNLEQWRIRTDNQEYCFLCHCIWFHFVSSLEQSSHQKDSCAHSNLKHQRSPILCTQRWQRSSSKCLGCCCHGPRCTRGGRRGRRGLDLKLLKTRAKICLLLKIFR